MMEISHLVGKRDLLDCVDLYISMNDPEFLPDVDADLAASRIMQRLRSGAFIRLLKEDGEVFAFIIGCDAHQDFASEPQLHQLYYASKYTTGTKAVKAVVLLHNELEVYARSRNLSTVVSPGSHMDETNVFSRILEKQGWTRRGHIALKNLRRHREHTSLGNALRS